jgi:hypothetical protein
MAIGIHENCNDILAECGPSPAEHSLVLPKWHKNILIYGIPARGMPQHLTTNPALAGLNSLIFS